MKEDIKKIKSYISENNTKEALKKLKALVANPFEKEIILLESRYSEIIKKNIIGISKNQETVQLQYDIICPN